MNCTPKMSGIVVCQLYLNKAIKKKKSWLLVLDSMYSQSHGFSNSPIHLWELDHNEGWAPKNQCFWTVVLEKTLESPFNRKETKPVNPKGNQPWIFIRSTDAEAEAPVLWPPDSKSQLIGKDPDAGKDWGQEEKGTTEDEMVGWHRWLNGCEFEQTQGDNEEYSLTNHKQFWHRANHLLSFFFFFSNSSSIFIYDIFLSGWSEKKHLKTHWWTRNSAHKWIGSMAPYLYLPSF